MEDFEALESESSECELKHRYHMNAHMAADCSADQLIKSASLKLSVPAPLGATEQDLGKACLKSSPEDFQADSRQQQQAKSCYSSQMLDGKPRIWSLAQTATSLNQTEYPSCMLRCPLASPPPSASLTPSPASSSPVTGPNSSRQQDSPVTTLRNWVDGVFHDPLFRHSSGLSQGGSSNTVAWSASTKGAMLEAAGLQQHQDPPKDMSFPKTVNKLFCS